MDEAPVKGNSLFRKLDRFLLYLLIGEFGYFVLLLLVGVGIAIRTLTLTGVAARHNLSLVTSLVPWTVLLPYSVAALANSVGGFASALLYLRNGGEGYPGTGNLLNWIFLISNSWIFIIVGFMILPGLLYGD
jgi:hypothetical protein